jgi:hypothetical protein
MKKLILFWLITCAAIELRAQYRPIVFDYEKASFNEGRPLPAETYLTVQGEVIPEIDIVKVFVYQANSGEVLYQGLWKRSELNSGNTFQIPLSYKLKSGTEYDFRIGYYRATDDSTVQAYKQTLFGYLDAYVDQAVVTEKNKIRLNIPVNKAISDLNTIVRRGIANYDNRSSIEFEGFSDLIGRSLKNIRNKDIKPGNFYSPDSAGSRQGRKYAYADDQITALKDLIHSEVNTIFSTNLSALYDVKQVKGYPTEKLSNVLTLNAGYGAVYLEGDVNNLSYDHGPYVGVSFPLGNPAFAPKLFSNTTLSAGIFLTNFKNANNQTLTGPVVSRPVYVGLGYSIVDFLRLQAGATVLQNTATAPDGVNLQAVTVRPYVGLALDINVWLGLGRKNKLNR